MLCVVLVYMNILQVKLQHVCCEEMVHFFRSRSQILIDHPNPHTQLVMVSAPLWQPNFRSNRALTNHETYEEIIMFREFFKKDMKITHIGWLP